jgi:prepilin-type N-terminal cleavage/methylation domain-containing protein
MMRKLMNRRRERGFTLVEIMIVVLIIGILLAIAVPNFMSARERSRANACRSNLRQIQAAKEQWAMANNQGPTSLRHDWPDLVHQPLSRHAPSLPFGWNLHHRQHAAPTRPAASVAITLCNRPQASHLLSRDAPSRLDGAFRFRRAVEHFPQGLASPCTTLWQE